MKIKLGNGLEALIDDEDKDLIGLGWYAHRDNRNKDYYAAHRGTLGAGQRFRLWLHREVAKAMGLDWDENDRHTVIDHINQDKLDCRRANLRVATRSQNEINKKQSRGASKY